MTSLITSDAMTPAPMRNSMGSIPFQSIVAENATPLAPPVINREHPNQALPTVKTSVQTMLETGTANSPVAVVTNPLSSVTTQAKTGYAGLTAAPIVSGISQIVPTPGTGMTPIVIAKPVISNI